MVEPLVHVVDDEEEVCRSTAFLMRIAGRRSQTWTSGEAFLNGADCSAPGCVILDVRMPGIDGLEVQKVLSERSSKLRVIMVSGHSDVGLRSQAIAAGADYFLEKPYDVPGLLAAVKKLVD